MCSPARLQAALNQWHTGRSLTSWFGHRVHFAGQADSITRPMKLLRLCAKNYRSLQNAIVGVNALNLFIGANAAGKSNILDALRFLQEGASDRDFASAVRGRGGILNLAWKGASAEEVELTVELASDGDTIEWSLRLIRDGYNFIVEEKVDKLERGAPPTTLLEARAGSGWWWSGEKHQKVELKQSPTICALAAAAADASFPARELADFIRTWGFFDPHPFLLRRDWSGTEFRRFDPYGRNLGETLFALERSNPEGFRQIVEATQDVLGLATKIEPRQSDDRFYFLQREPGLEYPVHQMGVSSGTLRMLALMTALFSESDANLIGIEEPENYVHPTAIASFVEYIRESEQRVQFIITTHSPLLLDYLGDPAAVRIVTRGADGATSVSSEAHGESIREALHQSGFGLGAFYETQGFGAN